MSGETLSYCPLSKASAALNSADAHVSRAICASLRMRSSTTLLRIARSVVGAHDSILARLSPSRALLACSKIERFGQLMRCEIDRRSSQLNERRRRNVAPMHEKPAGKAGPEARPSYPKSPTGTQFHQPRRFALVAMAAAAVRFSTPSLA